jgi:hypothetical protein
MKPIFTVHAGEYLVATHIEKNFPFLVPKYLVKPDVTGKGYKVYPAGKPVLPLHRIEKRGN